MNQAAQPNASLQAHESASAPAEKAKSEKAKSEKAKSEKAKTILLGALAVFTNQGYAAASMDRIAKAAGVSKPTLYTHFKNKEGLFIALIQQMTEKNNQLLLSLPTELSTHLPPDQVLAKIATEVLENFSSNRTLLTLMRLIIGESERFPELAQAFVREIKKPLLEKLVLYLSAQSQLNLPDPTVAARIFVGALVHYIIVQKVMQGETILPLEHDRMVKGLVHQMLAGRRS